MTDRSVTYEFKAKFTNLRAQMAAGGRSVNDFGKSLTDLDAKGDKARRGLTHFGSIAGKVALGAAAGLGAIVAVTANFDKSMSLVQAATGEAADGMDKLRDAALQAGADTAFSASEAADGITALAKAGVAVDDILSGGLTGALDLAAAGELGVADAAEIAATTMTQFGLAGEDVTHIADVLAAAAGKAQGEVTDMAGALKYVGPVAAQMGISLEETAGSIAYLASQGVLGEQAGTSLRGMLTALTSPSSAAKEKMDELGISMYDAAGNFIGLDGVAQQLQESMGGLDNATRDQALGQIFGNEQITTARLLYAGGADAVEEWTNKVNDSGFAAEQAETKLDNLAGDLEALKGSLETALIGAGESSQGPLRKLVQSLTDVTNTFNEMPGFAKSSVTGILAATAVLGGGLWATSKVIQGIASTEQALQDLGFQAGITKRAMSGLAKAGAGLLVFEGVTFALDELVGKLKTPISGATINRDLEALADGRVTDNLQDMSIWLGDIQDKWERDWNPVARLSPLDMSGFEDAERGLGDLDESLAQLVESGNAAQAAAAFKQIQTEAAAAGLSGSELTDIFDEYRTALENVGLADTGFGGQVMQDLIDDTVGVSEATDTLGVQVDNAAIAAEQATPKFEEMSDALKASIKSARGVAEEFFNLGANLDKGKVSLSDWIKDMEEAAVALRRFRENAEKAAKNGLDDGLIASLQEAGTAGALRMKQLANATDAEIKRANRAWRAGREEVRAYTDEVGGVPKRVSTEFDVDTGEALQKVHGLITAMSSVHDKVVHITAVFDRNNVEMRAAGGYISGPGTTTSDSIPARLSDGEYVVKAAAVQKYGVAMFDQLNAMHFANGGYATRSTTAHRAPAAMSAGAAIDYDRLAAAMLQARPLYGPVHISGDPTTFKRELAADARRTSLGGF